MLVSQELESAYRLPKYYFMDLDSWLKWSSYILASVVTMMKGRDDWNRFVATLAILLSWAELMFQVSRNPNWGYYINMFSKVALNVLKVSKYTRFLYYEISACTEFLLNGTRRKVRHLGEDTTFSTGMDEVKLPLGFKELNKHLF